MAPKGGGGSIFTPVKNKYYEGQINIKCNKRIKLWLHSGNSVAFTF